MTRSTAGGRRRYASRCKLECGWRKLRTLDSKRSAEGRRESSGDYGLYAGLVSLIELHLRWTHCLVLMPKDSFGSRITGLSDRSMG